MEQHWCYPRHREVKIQNQLVAIRVGSWRAMYVGLYVRIICFTTIKHTHRNMSG